MVIFVRPILPQPALLNRLPGSFTLGLNVSLALGTGTLSSASKNEFSALWTRFTLNSGKLAVTESASLSAFQGIIGTAEAITCPENEEYALTVTENGIAIASRDARGFCHALTTLLQLILPIDAETFALPCLTILDHPVLKERMIHLCVFPETTLDLLEKSIRLAGFMKYTHVIIEFWGMFRYECMASLSWAGLAFSADEIKPLIDLIRALGMEPVPMLNHLGHATQSRQCYGRHTVLDQDPTKALLFEPDGWSWCLSNPDTLNLLKTMRQELISLFGSGEYFHLGCDESYSFASCPRCREKVQHELLAGYLNGIAEELALQGRRPIIWGDQLLDAARWNNTPGISPNQRKEQTTHKALPLLDRRIVIADWHYGLTTPELPTARYFKEEGFDVLACPWDNRANIEAMSQAAIDMQLPGIIVTTWDHLPAYIRKMDQAATMAWCGHPNPLPNIFTEMASLLRRVMPYPHSFANAGWNTYETLEFDRALKDL